MHVQEAYAIWKEKSLVIHLYLTQEWFSVESVAPTQHMDHKKHLKMWIFLSFKVDVTYINDLDLHRALTFEQVYWNRSKSLGEF